MENEKLNNIPIAILLLIYLFVCGILYLIGFWSTFDVDVFSLISIYDIPKSFAFPLLVTQGFFVLNIISGNIIHFNDDRDDKTKFVSIKPEWGTFRKVLCNLTTINLVIAAAISLMATTIPDHLNSQVFWSISSLLTAYYFLHKFVNLEIVKNNFNNKLVRFFIGHFLIFLPISCFSTGKLSSLSIRQNSDIKYIKIISTKNASIDTDTTSFKLLGFISDKILYGTLDNKKIYILNKDSYEAVILTKKDKNESKRIN